MTQPTPTQALLLFGLLARHGECPQAELMPAVKKADREALAKAKLVAVEKVGRGLGLRLEDAGWAWAGANLSAELPPAQRALSDLLARLGEHLARSGETLAEVIGVKPVAPAKAAGKPKPANKRKAQSGSPKPKPSSKTKRQASTSAADLILRAYAEITGGRTGRDVSLVELRAKLPNVGRDAIDAALTEMHLNSGKARLMRIENSRVLTEADRQSALHFKGNVFHALWMES